MKVKFMYHKQEKDLYAYFPESVRTGVFGTMYECYGQGTHSVCDRGYIEQSGEVDAEKYKPLLIELMQLYNNDIQVV